MNMANMAPPPRRLVMIDGEGKLRSAQGERIDMITDAPFTIVVLGDLEHGTSWLGWLTTSTRRSVCFGAADLADPVFQSWLHALPGWEQTKLLAATTKQGLHVVWCRISSSA